MAFAADSAATRDEMGLPQEEPTILECDNSGAVELAKDRKSCHRSRHVHRRYFKVRELHARGDIKMVKIATQDNSADVLTKPLPADVFAGHLEWLMGVAQ